MRYALVLLIVLSAFIVTSCAPAEPRIVYITATFQPGEIISPENIGPADATPDVSPTEVSTPAGTSVAAAPPQAPASGTRQHVVQAGDTLSGIAQQYGTTLRTLLEINTLDNPDVLNVGQVIVLPDLPTDQTPALLIIPDSRFVRGVEGAAFDVSGFVASAGGYIRMASDTVTDRLANGETLDRTLNSAQIITRVSQEYSVDPRLLIAMLEHRAQWVSQPEIDEALREHPLISEEVSTINRKGLYRQLSWLANELNRGYYGSKYEDWQVLEFNDGARLTYAQELNAATVALQYFLALNNEYARWQRDTSVEGFSAVYSRLFGDALLNAPAASVPALDGISQPELTLPFASGEVWFFTGGAHGGWGSGSAWSSVDFAPPDERTDNRLCYASETWATAVADGVIARSENGTVVLDLDGDGNEATGWVIFYLHLAADERVQTGQRVSRGDRIGRPSCEGGFSTATHLHIGRKYNGEWIPVQCFACAGDDPVPPFVMGGWRVVGLRGQEYQGYLVNGGERRVAEQGRISPINRVSW